MNNKMEYSYHKKDDTFDLYMWTFDGPYHSEIKNVPGIEEALKLICENAS